MERSGIFPPAILQKPLETSYGAFLLKPVIKERIDSRIRIVKIYKSGCAFGVFPAEKGPERFVDNNVMGCQKMGEKGGNI